MSAPDITEELIRNCAHMGVLRATRLERIEPDGPYFIGEPHDICEACGEYVDIGEEFFS